MTAYTFSYSSWYMLFYVNTNFADVSIYRGLHISAVAGKNVTKYFIMPRKDWGSFLLVAGGMAVSTSHLDIISLKKGALVHLK